MTDKAQRIRYGPDEVLDQIETRERRWNSDTLSWEPVTEDELKGVRSELKDMRRVLEEILLTLKGG